MKFTQHGPRVICEWARDCRGRLLVRKRSRCAFVGQLKPAGVQGSGVGTAHYGGHAKRSPVRLLGSAGRPGVPIGLWRVSGGASGRRRLGTGGSWMPIP